MNIKLCTMLKFYIFSIISFIFFACDNKPVDRNAFKDEMENREIMRVTAGQLSNYAFQKGKLALDSIDKIFQIRLDSAIANNIGKDFCNTNNIALINRLQKEVKITVNRYTKEEITDTTSKLYQVFDAYQFNVAAKNKCEDNLQKIEDKTLILTRAIVLDNQKCMSCHANSNQTSKKSTIFNKSKGDLLGIWAFEMPKKELIKKITVKDLKKLKEQ